MSLALFHGAHLTLAMPVQLRIDFDVACGLLVEQELIHKYIAYIGVGGEYEGMRKRLSYSGAVSYTSENREVLDTYGHTMEYGGGLYVECGNKVYASAMKGLAYSMPAGKKPWDGEYNDCTLGDYVEVMLGCDYIANVEKEPPGPLELPPDMDGLVLREYKYLLEDVVVAAVAIHSWCNARMSDTLSSRAFMQLVQ